MSYQGPDRLPKWTEKSTSVSAPTMDVWYNPDTHGILDGVLIWRGLFNFDNGEKRGYMVKVGDSENGFSILGVWDRPGLKGLERAAIGSRVCVRPVGSRDVGQPSPMRVFEVFVETVAKDEIPF